MLMARGTPPANPAAREVFLLAQSLPEYCMSTLT